MLEKNGYIVFWTSSYTCIVNVHSILRGRTFRKSGRWFLWEPSCPDLNTALLCIVNIHIDYQFTQYIFYIELIIIWLCFGGLNILNASRLFLKRNQVRSHALLCCDTIILLSCFQNKISKKSWTYKRNEIPGEFWTKQ